MSQPLAAAELLAYFSLVPGLALPQTHTMKGTKNINEAQMSAPQRSSGRGKQGFWGQADPRVDAGLACAAAGPRHLTLQGVGLPTLLPASSTQADEKWLPQCLRSLGLEHMGSVSKPGTSSVKGHPDGEGLCQG